MTQAQHSHPNASENSALSREVRVFMSSTFRDMDAERNHLLGTVFPEIAEECRQRGVGFTEIDLRWGVTEEESKNGRTVQICLEQIDECREYPPFFIGLLGERYGWIPVHEELSHYWAEHSGSPYARRIQTALDQRISVTELEMQYGILDNPHNTDHARVFLRSAEFTAQLAQQLPESERDEFFADPTEQQEQIKDKLRQKNLVALDGYNSVEELGAAIKAFMLAQIEHIYPKAQAPSRAEQRDSDHAFYADSRRKAYVPLLATRTKVLGFIEQSFASTADRPAPRCLLIEGPSGRGKTAFIADLQHEFSRLPNIWQHAHYMGADGDLSLNGWLDRLGAALQATGKLSQPLPDKIQDRWEALPTALLEVQAGLNQPMLLLLDAFDQCSEPDTADRLRTLAASLLPQVCVLITVTPDKKPHLPQAQEIELPALDAAQRKAAVEAFLHKFGKKLPDAILDNLVHSARCGEPLFLRLLLEELRLHARYETLDSVSQTLLHCADAGALFGSALQEMNRDFADARHPELASHAAHLLVASYRGLRKNDLALLLGQEGDPVDPARQKPRLPDALLGPLLARLEPYCLRNAGRSFIMHAILRNALLDQTSTTQIRQELISHFHGDDSDALCERIFQRMALGEEIALADELTLPNTLRAKEDDDDLLRAALSQLKAGETQATPAIQRIMQRWQEQIQQAEALDAQTISRFNQLSVWLSKLAFQNLNQLLLEACTSASKRLPKDDEDLSMRKIDCKNNLSMCYLAQGLTDKAELLISEALEDFNSINQSEFHPEKLLLLNNRATIYMDQKKFKEAEPILEKILDIRRKTHTYTDDVELDQRNIVFSLNNLGTCLYYLNKLDKAEQYCNEALSISRSLSSEKKLIADALNNLGLIYEDQKLYDKAEGCFKESLAIARAIYPKNHPDVAGSLNNLAYFYLKRDKFMESSDLYEELLSMVSVCQSGDYPDIIDVALNLVSAYSDSDNFEMAIESIEKGLSILHLISSEQLHNFSGLYCYEKPTKCLDERLGGFLALAIQEMEKIAQTNFHQKKYKEAYFLYVKVFSLQLEYLPKDEACDIHKSNLDILSGICKAWVKLEPEFREEIYYNFQSLMYEFTSEYPVISNKIYPN